MLSLQQPTAIVMPGSSSKSPLFDSPTVAKVRMLQGLEPRSVATFPSSWASSKGLVHLEPIMFSEREDVWTEFHDPEPAPHTPPSRYNSPRIPVVKIQLKVKDQQFAATPETPHTTRRLVVLPPDETRSMEASPKSPVSGILKRYSSVPRMVVKDNESNYVSALDPELPLPPRTMVIPMADPDSIQVKEYDFMHLLNKQQRQFAELPDDIEIWQADMPMDMQLRVIEAVYGPLSQLPRDSNSPLVLQPIAMALKKYMQALDGPSWHVVLVVGQFSSFISHEPNRMMHFRFRRFIVLLWKVER